LTILSGILTLARIHWSNRGALFSGLILLSLFFMGQEWEIRPHLLSWVFLSLLFAVLEAVGRGHRRLVWALPPIMLVWANCHSLYILGLVAIACHSLAWLVQEFNSLRKTGSWHTGMAVACAGFACLMTPFGIDGIRFPFMQFELIGSSSVFSKVIAELQSPLAMSGYLFEGRWVPFAPALFWQASLVLIAMGYLINWRQVKIAEWLVLILFGYIFIKANKSFGYFIIATLPTAARGWSIWCMRRHSIIAARPLLMATMSVLWVLTTAWVVTDGWHKARWSTHRFGHEWNSSTIPAGASDVLSRAPASAKNLVTLDYGGFVGFTSGGPVYIDGRIEVYGPDHYRRYHKTKEAKGALEEMRLIQPDWVLVQHAVTPVWNRFLAGRPGWRRVYADEWCALYFWKDYAPAIPSAEWVDLPEEVTVPTIDDPLVRQWLDNASQQPDAGFIDRLSGAALFPVDSLRKTAACLMIGEKAAARTWAMHGLKFGKRFYPDMWVNAAYAFRANGELEHAVYCLSILAKRGHQALADKIGSEILVSD
jgi:hypothetical protein